MKLNRRGVGRFIVIAALAATGSAFAGGTHAGGHDEDEAAIGVPGVAAKADRTVHVKATDDFRFTPSHFSVKRGETMRLVIENDGKIKHEFMLGTQKELTEHAALMRKFPNMEHDEPSSVSLAPGEKRDIVWKFTQPGEVDFGCLIPGHYEAGMKGAIQVGAKR